MTVLEASKWARSARTALIAMGKPAIYSLAAIDDLERAIRFSPSRRKARIDEFKFNVGNCSSEIGERVCLFCISVLQLLETSL